MTDEELIAALRKEDAYNEEFYVRDPLHKKSADRIEALVKERDAEKARADRLEAALRKIAAMDLMCESAIAFNALRAECTMMGEQQ